MEIQKKVVFLGTSREALRSFPKAVRDDAGYQLHRVQCGLRATDCKPMPDVGRGAEEIRVREKTQRTPRSDIELAADRLRELLRKRR